MKDISKINLKLVTYLMMLSIYLSGCAASKDVFYSDSEVNEKSVIAKILNIISNQATNFESEKRYATAQELEIERRQEKGYKIEMVSDEKSFQIRAAPIEYEKTGKRSFYADSNDGNIRGADHQGKNAASDDPIVQNVLDETKNKLKKNQEAVKAIDSRK